VAGRGRPGGDGGDPTEEDQRVGADVLAGLDPGLRDPSPPAGRSLDRSIWALAGPALLTLAAEPLYLLVDTAIVGRLGTDALAGLAIASSLLLFVAGVCIFLTFGTAATVARALGSDDRRDAAELSAQSLWLALACATVTTPVLAAVAAPLVGRFTSDPGVVADALVYLRISLVGLPAILLTMAATGALRGHLDARTPMVVAIAANVGNLVLEVLLVVVAGWGLAGSAAGTVVAQWAGAAVLTWAVLRLVRGEQVTWGPQRSQLTRLAVVGRDLFVRTVALRAALTATTFLAARRGAVVLAAFQVAFQWWTFLAFLLDALEAAAQSLVGRALGAGDRSLARATAGRILAWSVGGGALLGAVTTVFAGPISRLFTDDAAVLGLVVTSLWWVGCMQPVNGAAFALDGILVGAGDQRFLALAMVASLGVLAAGGAVFLVADTALWGLWCSVGAFMLSRVVVLGGRYRSTAWQRLGA
jgi:putative MATE family efflux protein